MRYNLWKESSLGRWGISSGPGVLAYDWTKNGGRSKVLNRTIFPLEADINGSRSEERIHDG